MARSGCSATGWWAGTPDVSTWSVYLVRCADDSLYIGISTDVDRRLRQHRKGRRGARYLRGRVPIELVYSQPVGDRSCASRIEVRLKQLAKRDKERLLRRPALMKAHIESLLAGD
jgi:putative endonuclease